MDKYYSKTIEELYKFFSSSEEGLSTKQVEKNKKKYGKNFIEEKKKDSKAKIFLKQFQDMLVIILIISAVISIFIGDLESTIVIFFIIVVNAILGTSQYFKAEKSLDSLKMLSSPTVNVIRDKQVLLLKPQEIVCGDVVIVNAGDVICADGIIIQEDSLEINESSLTGESQAVGKSKGVLTNEVALNERKNTLFSGTFCVKGHAKYIVTNVGMTTEIGKIASLLTDVKKQKMPLQNSLDSFSKYLAIIIILICFFVFLMGLYKNSSFFDSLMFSVSLAVAAIPEALNTIVVIVLAIGTQKMAKEKAIVKELKAVEGLGCISILCTDKTGTITMNKMEVRTVKNYLPLSKFREHVLYSTNYDVYQVENASPTEKALINYAKCSDDCFKGIKIQEIGFSSKRKMMSNLYKYRSGNILYCKGAPEVIINKSIFIEDLSNKNTFSDLKKEKILDEIKKEASKGRRIIAFAYKMMYTKVRVSEEDENSLVFSGFISLIDPPRVESKPAITDLKNAGIKPIMLTGDNKDTAVAIAREVGIYEENDLVLSGVELDKISDEELRKKVLMTSVFSRLTPQHKIRIIKSLQENDEVVSMTGDGINDAPALKQADISIAIGEGTEVAKDASSIILVDNNLSTIVKAVKNGRKVYKNIQNAIKFLLSGNFAGIMIVIVASLLSLPVPFAAVHLLFINLVTDSFPAIAIGIENSSDNVMMEKPRNKKEHFLTKRIGMKIFIEGTIIAVCCLGSFSIGLNDNISVARTMTFSTLCIARLFHSFSCASEVPYFMNKDKNIFLIVSFILLLFLVNLVLFLPVLSPIFLVAKLTTKQILGIYCYSIMPTIIIQVYKTIKIVLTKVRTKGNAF